MNASYVSPRVSAAAPAAVPQTARQTRSVMPVAMQSPRLNAQQIIFWPTAQTVRSLPLASPHGVSPRQIPSAGDPLRFLGSGYPPRQMVTARQGADRGRDARDVRDALTSYVPHEVKGMKPLTTKVFGPPKVILPVQEAKRSYPILRSFSGAGKEVAESPRDVVETEGGMTPISKEAPKPSLSVAGTPATPAMASATSAASSASIASLVAPGQRQVAVATSSPTAVAAVAIASSTAPAATVVPTPVPVTAEVAKASTPAASQSSLPSDVQPAAESQTAQAASQEALRFRWPAGSSTPSKAPFAGNLWPGAVATTAPCRVISARLQPCRVIGPEAKTSSPRNEGMEKDGANESNDSDAIFPTSGTPAAPAASAPVSMVPAPVISRAGTYTPPHFEMFRSISTQSDMRQRSPRSRLGVTVRNLSPKTRGVAGGLLISPSPLSVSSRQPLAPRRSGSPLSSKALQDLHVRSPAPQASPMTRQRTLPGNLQPERSSTTILTAQNSTAPLEAAAPGVSTGASTVELITEKPPARAVGEGRASEIYRRRWRRPSNPAIPHPTDPPGTAHHDGNDFTPGFVRLQEKLSYLAEEGTVSL